MVRAILLPPPATVLRKAMPAPKLNFGVERRRSAGRRGFGGAIALALVAVLLPAAPVQANDIAPFTTVFGTDVVHAGFGGMRDDGTGTLTVSGVSGSVTKALLYWHGPTNSSDPTANAAVTFAGNPVTGTNIGLSDDNCWNYANSQGYRADVTALVTGNGTYALAGFVKDGGNINVNGASLIVFFNDGNATNNRDVVLFDGNDSNIPNAFDADGWNVSLPGITYTNGSAAITMHVSDGQGFPDDALILNGSTLVPSGPIFEGDSVPFGTFNADGHLWDIHSYDVTSFLSPGPNTLTLTTGLNSDCLSLVVAAIDLPAGAAPPAKKATTTDYTGATSVQYSDAAALAANLSETDGGAPVPGKTIDFTLGTQSTSAGPTDASGNVATSLVVTQQPGSVTAVTAAFAGDADFEPSTKTEDFAINKEDCTLVYTGDTVVDAANTTTLSAQFGEPDPTPGDWTNKSVTFTVTDTTANVQTFTAATDAAGVASASVALSPDVYSVGVSFSGDDFYLPCSTSTDTIVTVQAVNAKITGGGWISQGAGRTNFGFNVFSDVIGLHGQLQIRTHGNKGRFHSSSVLTLSSSGNSGTWTGTGLWNGVDGYTFGVSVVDNGTSGKKGDTISITVLSPTNVTVFTTGGPAPLKGGNIFVH